jgi:hypothetical protein
VDSLALFAAYSLGMDLVLTAVVLGAALLRGVVSTILGRASYRSSSAGEAGATAELDHVRRRWAACRRVIAAQFAEVDAHGPLPHGPPVQNDGERTAPGAHDRMRQARVGLLQGRPLIGA